MSLKKAPLSRLPFGYDYVNWLDPNETVDSAVWTADEENIDTSMAIDDTSITGTVVAAWLTGGTPGQWYVFRVLVTTSAGKIDEQAIHVACEEP